MSDERRTIELGQDEEAMRVTGGLAVLAAVMAQAGPSVQKFLDGEIQQFTAGLLHRVGALQSAGVALPTEQANLGVVFEEAAKFAAENESEFKDVSKKLTPAILKIATELAETIDAAIRSRMVTAACDTHVDHNAFLDIIQGHATLMRGIEQIDSIPADYSPASNGEAVH
jgi:hypothetical protein